MSADYDRLFHSPDAAPSPDEETAAVDRDSVYPGNAGPMPSHAARPDAPSGPMPVAATPTKTAAGDRAAAAPDRDHQPDEADPTTGQQRVANGMMRAPQAAGPAGARYEQARPAPAPPARQAPAPAPSQHFAEPQPRVGRSGPRPSRLLPSPRRPRPPRSAITAPSTRCRTSASGPRSRCRHSAAGVT